MVVPTYHLLHNFWEHPIIYIVLTLSLTPNYTIYHTQHLEGKIRGREIMPGVWHHHPNIGGTNCLQKWAEMGMSGLHFISGTKVVFQDFPEAVDEWKPLCRKAGDPVYISGASFKFCLECDFKDRSSPPMRSPHQVQYETVEPEEGSQVEGKCWVLHCYSWCQRSSILGGNYYLIIGL